MPGGRFKEGLQEFEEFPSELTTLLLEIKIGRDLRN